MTKKMQMCQISQAIIICAGRHIIKGEPQKE